MEKVLNSTNDNTQSISIYGDNNQVFQIVLKTNGGILFEDEWNRYVKENNYEKSE